MAAAAGQVIEAGNTISGGFGILRNAGAPVNGTNEVQTLTIGGAPTAGPTSGIVFSFQGIVAPIALWSATNATFIANIQAALDALFGTGATVVTNGTGANGVGTYIITFSGAVLSATNLGAAIGVVNQMTGAAPTAAMARTTPGVTATFRNAPPGQILVDTTNRLSYHNSSATLGAPTWVAIA